MLGDNNKQPELEEVDVEDKKNNRPGFVFPWSIIVIVGILTVLIAICIIIIVIFGGPVK